MNTTSAHNSIQKCTSQPASCRKPSSGSITPSINMSTNYFNLKRTQPFIITLFMAIMAFKRVCKMMKKRLALIHKKGHIHQMTPFRAQLKKSNISVRDALRGRDVIQSAYIQAEIEAERNPFHLALLKNEPKVIRKISTKKKVAAYLDDYQIKLRLGKGAPATVDRLQKSLVASDIKPPSPKHSKHTKRKAVIVEPMKMSDIKDIKAMQQQQEDEESDAGGDDELGYEPGTSIYFGATIALQARHGGYLSYNSSQIKASAHKVLNHTRFIVKNSEDLTDAGVMKYGDALWLQAGMLDVLGAQYGTLVDQKRTIQPALVSCTRKNMFKAQQYGRWIVLNRNQPMQTLGKPVLHDDKIMLEQEWFFLASSSPYNSSMYKTLNNSDEAMTTKVDLFQPGDECSWKIHLVALPSEDRAGELQRQLLLQQAKENIDASAAKRYEKAPNLLTSLASKLPQHLTDDAMIDTSLHRKLHNNENQKFLLETYRDLGAKQFHSKYNPTKFLSRIYGANSNIVRYKAFVLESQQSDDALEYNHANHHNQDNSWSTDEQHKSLIERLHDQYWNSAQRVLVDTQSWQELPSAMAPYHRHDRQKKVQAALVLQRWIRKYLSTTFDFARAMKRVDAMARKKLQEKLIARRKLLVDHTTAMEASDEHEQRKNKSGGHGHMHGSISSVTTQSQTQKHGHGVHGSNSILHPSQSHRHKHTTSSSSIATPHVTLRQNGGVATRSNSLCVDAFGDSIAPLHSSEGHEDRRRSKSVKRSMSISEINDISQLVGAAGMLAIFNAAGMTPPHPSHHHGQSHRYSVSQSIGVGDRPGPHAPADMIFQHTEVNWDETPSLQENFTSDELPQRTMEQSHQTQSLPQLGVESPTTHRKDSHATAMSAVSHKNRSNSIKSRMDGAHSFASYLGFPQPSNREKLGSPSIIEESVRPHSAGPYDTLTSTGSMVGTGIACKDEPVSPTSMRHATYHATPHIHTSQKQTHLQVQAQGHAQGQGLGPGHGHTSTMQRPHTANAAVRPSGPTHEELEEMEQKEAARRHEAHKARRREELHAQALKDRRRLCRSASNAFGLPKDVFHGVKDDVGTKIGLKFLRAMSANPSIYDDVQVKKRASSSYGRTTRPPKSNIW